MTLPDLRTARLELRPFTLDDVDPLHRLWTEPAVRRYLWDGEVISRARSLGVVESSIASAESTGIGMWSVRLSGEPQIIGFCGFRAATEPTDAELVYGIDPAHQGKGFATEASQAVLRHGFGALGLRRIVAGADKPNKASLRVMEKLGFHFDATRVNAGRDEEWWTLTTWRATP